MRRWPFAFFAILASAGAQAVASPVKSHGPHEFRQLFLSQLVGRGMKLRDAQKLVYAVPEVDEPSTGSPEARLAALDEAHKGPRPTHLYARGLRQPFSPLADPLAPLRSKGPISIVVLPGIFGEFIQHIPFEEFFRRSPKNAFLRQWKAALASHGNAEDRRDTVFSLERLDSVTLPIEDLVEVASYDDANGRPLVKAIFLKPRFASLETFGTLRENSEIYSRRLSKIFAIIGVPENLHILGYSRGAAVALELAVRANERVQGAPRVAWGPQIQGVISHAGALYGTVVADASEHAHTPVGALTHGMRKLAAELETDHIRRPQESKAAHKKRCKGMMARNWARWARALERVAVAVLRAPKPNQGLGLERIWTELPGLKSTFTLIKQFVFEQYNLVQPTLHLLTGRNISRHFENMLRFRAMAKKMVDGGVLMTTKARLDWWRNNTLPAHIKLYSIAATMPDVASKARKKQPHFDKKGVCVLTADRVIALPSSPDYLSLRMNYYDIVRQTGSELNDGQMPLQRARFWPALNKSLNPNQPDLRTYTMGVLGQDHWGVGFPTAFDLTSKKVNPFPRDVLLLSIATFIAATPQ